MMSEAALKAGNKRRVKKRLNRCTIATAGIESRSCNLSNLAIGCGSRQKRKPATVRAQQPDQPRSYTLEASGSIVRRNRSALLPYFQESHRSQVELQDNPISKPEIASSPSETVTSQKDAAVCTRSGRVTRPPKRLDLLSVETHLPKQEKGP